jgi:mRNA interferase RelE/StbE
MKYQIKFRSSAVSEIESLQPKLQQRVRLAIDALEDDPRPMGYKKLKGVANLYRIRISDIRVVYTIEDSALLITVIMVADRREIYKRLKKNL